MSGRSGAGAGRADGGTGSSAAGGSGPGGGGGPDGGGGAPHSWITRPPKAPRPGRLVAYLALVILGAVVGTAGSLVQAAWMPGGLVLALLACAGLFVGSLRATGSQLGVACSAVGWLAAVVVLSTGRPEGDAMFGAGLGPLVFMLGGMAVAVMCATMSRASQPSGA